MWSVHSWHMLRVSAVDQVHLGIFHLKDLGPMYGRATTQSNHQHTTTHQDCGHLLHTSLSRVHSAMVTCEAPARPRTQTCNDTGALRRIPSHCCWSIVS